MTERVLLHVGAMKTGTSYLQRLLEVNRDSLLEAGVLVAPQRSAAVHDLTDHASRGQERLEQVRGTWDRVARKLRKAPQRTAVLSHEFLGLQDPAVVRRALASFKGAEVHVLVTVRDASAVLPAQWQSAARNKGTLTWPEYAAGAREQTGKSGHGHTFLRAQRVGRMLRQWGEGLGPDALHVVTVPRPGATPDLLWRRVAGVLEVDPAAAPERDVRTNPSAGYATAHLLCLLHQAAEHTELPVAQRRRLLVFLAEDAVARRDAEGRPPLDEETLAFCAGWNARVRAAAQRSGAEVAGSWDDLPEEPDLSGARSLEPPPDVAVLTAAAAASATLAALAGEDRARSSPGSVDAAVTRLVEGLEHAWRSGAVDRLSGRGRELRPGR